MTGPTYPDPTPNPMPVPDPGTTRGAAESLQSGAQGTGTGSGHRGIAESEDGRSIGQLLSDVTSTLSTLMRQEVALAKAEASQSASRAGKGIGMFAGAAVAGLLLLVFISLSAMFGFGQFMGYEWAALIVASVWAIVAVILAVVGRNEMRRIRGVPDTTDTLSKVPNALKGQEEMNR
ncbi:phage holin family protein [Desertihabitans aurantiacus]|uniref:phage holin family protein n=1 Tax=Desertihabitans aurantiacus TaxID=2282477 RepID=UPI0018E58785|nr:phage holin family protein [Desertihabitans aurantiacus]